MTKRKAQQGTRANCSIVQWPRPENLCEKCLCSSVFSRQYSGLIKSKRGVKDMNLDALLEAALWLSNGPLKERLAPKRNRATSEFLLEHVKLGIQELRPELDPESPMFRTAVILMSAAYCVGPHVDLIVQFTGYSIAFVGDISDRMRAYRLWSEEKVCTDYWFNGDTISAVFWVDCLLAAGLAYVERTADGFGLCAAFDFESKILN
jgi:hypothetical protein